MSKQRLPPGTWLKLRYGFETVEFYVSSESADQVRLTAGSWLPGRGIWMDKAKVLNNSKILGQGKRRAWWPFLLFLKVCFCPYSGPVQEAR